ncbi:hypothetical protein SDC9_146365 [bioreactor metagenome]|uniref:Uncharacterized protein n=1 Tax=bioreactor metagenome TaxID=1076179 RepID=A0A645EAU1_9ZZZZ
MLLAPLTISLKRSVSSGESCAIVSSRFACSALDTLSGKESLEFTALASSAAGLICSRIVFWRQAFSSAYPENPSIWATRTSCAFDTFSSSAISPIERKEASRIFASRYSATRRALFGIVCAFSIKRFCNCVLSI